MEHRRACTGTHCRNRRREGDRPGSSFDSTFATRAPMTVFGTGREALGRPVAESRISPPSEQFLFHANRWIWL